MAIEIALEEEHDHTLILDLFGFEKRISVTKKRFIEACMEGSIAVPIPYDLAMFAENEVVEPHEKNPYRYIEFERSAAKEDSTSQRFLVVEFKYSRR